MDGAARSYELLRQRVDAIPDALVRALEDDHPARAREAFAQPSETLTIVGAGGSAGPARFLTACLQMRGWSTRCVPPSAFFLSSPPGPCAVVSQGMSPNARLALSRVCGPRLVVTASTVARDDPRNVALEHGPPSEPEMLVRVLGPALASFAALRFSQLFSDDQLAELPAQVASATCALPDRAFDSIVLLAAGAYTELAHGLRWKLLETLGYGDPPVYGVLQFAHGPFQQIYDKRVLILALDRGTPEEDALFSRLEEMVVVARHTVVRLRASLPHPLCWFEHDAMLNRLVLALLERKPRDLIDWPGKGHDARLYSLDR